MNMEKAKVQVQEMMERKKVCDKLKKRMKKKVMQTEEKLLPPPHVLLGVRVKGTDFKMKIKQIFFLIIFLLSESNMKEQKTSKENVPVKIPLYHGIKPFVSLLDRPNI